MLTINNLTKGFKYRPLFNNLSFELDKGIYGFLGPNGAGKTTLIRCLCGVYNIKNGEIRLDNDYVSSKQYIKNLGYLPQSFGLFKDMKVYDALEYMAELKKIPKKEIKEEILNVLSKVNLSDKVNVKVRSLSGGMTRRLGIAQALIGDPKFLIFDEPTAGLDPEERIRFKKIIGNLSKDKIVLISTHICTDIEALCDKVFIINDGQILFNDTLDKLEAIGRENNDEDSQSESPLERGYLCLLGQNSNF